MGFNSEFKGLNSHLSSISSSLSFIFISLSFFPFTLPYCLRLFLSKLHSILHSPSSEYCTTLSNKLNQVTLSTEHFMFLSSLFIYFFRSISQLLFFCIFFFGTFLGTVIGVRSGRSRLRFVADARDVSLLRNAQTLHGAHLLSCFVEIGRYFSVGADTYT